MQGEFSGRRSRSVARLGAYTLIALFLINLLAASLPLPLKDPQRAFALLTSLLDRSILPLLATVGLFYGFADDALPALWECRLALVLRPLVRLLPMLYLLIAISVVVVAHRVEGRIVNGLNRNVQASLNVLSQVRGGVTGAADMPALRRLVDRQPPLVSVLRQQGISLGSDRPLAEQRDLVLVQISQLETDLRRQGFRSASEASGQIIREAVRLCSSALLYGVFFLGAGLIWPRSLERLAERIHNARVSSHPQD